MKEIEEAKDIIEAWNVLGIAEDMENGWERDVMISVVKLFFNFITTIESQKEEIAHLLAVIAEKEDESTDYFDKDPISRIQEGESEKKRGSKDGIAVETHLKYGGPLPKRERLQEGEK